MTTRTIDEIRTRITANLSFTYNTSEEFEATRTVHIPETSISISPAVELMFSANSEVTISVLRNSRFPITPNIPKLNY